MTSAFREDARVALLEVVFVVITLNEGRNQTSAEGDVVPPIPRASIGGTGIPTSVSRDSWEQLNNVDLEEVFLRRTPMLRSCPHFLRGRVRHCFTVTLGERLRAKVEGDIVGEERAWKAFALIPLMILNRPRGLGSIGKQELVERANKFARGQWIELLEGARQALSSTRRVTQLEGSEELRRRGLNACSRVKQGQVSRARQELVGASLAPKNLETLAQLQNRRPQMQVREIPVEVLASNPTPVNLDVATFTKCLASAPSGSAPGPGGCTYEMLKLCLDDAETSHLLYRAAEDLARAHAPESITRAFMCAMTALQKQDGGVRGIATGTSFRRLVAKTLARQFGKAVEAVCSPYQFALSTRVGTDCVGHAIRAFTDADPSCTVLSIDGVGAYDHVFRSSFLAKLHSVPSLQGLLLFVRSVYARPTTYVWEDGTGARHQIHQAEGGEQGDPLMPLLFSLGIHDSLRAVDERLRPEDKLFAYLDDVHVVSAPHRTRVAYNILAEQMLTGAGIQLHTGKTRVWNRGGTCPAGVEELGEEVWSPSGIKILGTPIGSPEFVRTTVAKRLEDEGQLWDAIAWVPDLQCSWQILLQCAGPVPSFAAHSASKPVYRVRPVSRRRHDACLGWADGRAHWFWRGEDGGSSVGFTPYAIGRSRITECGSNGPSSILVIVG